MTRKKPITPRSKLEETFAWQLKAALPNAEVERECRWHPIRKWRADFLIYYPDRRGSVMVEIEGAIYARGRHTRGAGFEADVEKYNEAVLCGYKLIRGTAKHVSNGQLLKWVERAL